MVSTPPEDGDDEDVHVRDKHADPASVDDLFGTDDEEEVEDDVGSPLEEALTIARKKIEAPKPLPELSPRAAISALYVRLSLVIYKPPNSSD